MAFLVAKPDGHKSMLNGGITTVDNAAVPEIVKNAVDGLPELLDGIAKAYGRAAKPAGTAAPPSIVTIKKHLKNLPKLNLTVHSGSAPAFYHATKKPWEIFLSPTLVKAAMEETDYVNRAFWEKFIRLVIAHELVHWKISVFKSTAQHAELDKSGHSQECVLIPHEYYFPPVGMRPVFSMSNLHRRAWMESTGTPTTAEDFLVDYRDIPQFMATVLPALPASRVAFKKLLDTTAAAVAPAGAFPCYEQAPKDENPRRKRTRSGHHIPLTTPSLTTSSSGLNDTRYDADRADVRND
eukprot:TRINITY_DN7018_c0_g1_i4.p1 TRINITY_DN7018_c0_g1~~TRINITY_DN7018_c0_g1_i4.p1  ORF type:complete len:295 (-),score=48.52 TRINITY_DN7018_c0_g1_i4:648-1532(-)